MFLAINFHFSAAPAKNLSRRDSSIESVSETGSSVTESFDSKVRKLDGEIFSFRHLRSHTGDGYKTRLLRLYNSKTRDLQENTNLEDAEWFFIADTSREAKFLEFCCFLRSLLFIFRQRMVFGSTIVTSIKKTRGSPHLSSCSRRECGDPWGRTDCGGGSRHRRAFPSPRSGICPT